MSTTFNEQWLARMCLSLIKERASSSGDITRRLMGLGKVPKDSTSYAEVKAILEALVAAGKATKAGNGKSVHYRAASS